MESVRKIASYICQRYKEEFGVRIDEMKLHKLLYFTQRECIIQTGKPMFEETFAAWQYGPVLVGIRQLYKQNALKASLSDEKVQEYKQIFDKIFSHYAKKSSISLSTLSHSEYSWRHARQKMMAAGGDIPIDVDDIAEDAKRIKTRRFVLEKLDALAD